MTSYKDLPVWQRAMDLAVECYQATASFPRSEPYGLTSEIRRAAVSIPSNVAAGRCRRTTKAYLNHVSIGLGSSGELATCITLSERLNFLTHASALKLAVASDEVGRMLSGLYTALDLKVRAGEDR
jgi:four helix bundle protein